MALEIFRLVGSVFVDTDKAEKSLKKTDKQAESFGSRLGTAAKTAGKFALGVVGAATAAGAAVVALTENTREYRTEQGKLQTAFEVQNFSAETARKTYTALNGVLGDSGQAVEAANHLAKLADNEKDLQKWTDICTGVYATFGDSLPIEGLTEAANETVRCGQLTGGLTDAINWAAKSGETFGVKLKANTKANEEWNKAVKAATSAEDFFNLALQDCSTEQERQALITETLNGLYSDASKKYQEVNADVIAANKAQDRLNASMAGIGGAMEPFVTKGKELIAEVLERLTPALEWLGTTALPWVSNAVSVVVQWFGDLIGKLGESGLSFDGVMQFIQTMFKQTMDQAKMIWETIGQPVWNYIKQAVQLVADYFKERMPQIKEFVKNTFTDIKNLWNNNLKPAFEAIGNFISNVLAPTFKWVFENVITPVADAAFKGIGQLWNNSLKPLLEGMIDFVKNVFSGNFSGAWQNVLDSFGAVWEGIKTIIKAPLNAAIGMINKFIGKINGIKIPDWVPGMGGSGVLNLKQIPLLVAGGVLEQGQVGLLEGTGAEAVVPLHNNKKWINAVAQDMENSLGGGQTADLLRELIDLQERTIKLLANGQVISLNGRELGRTVRQYA